MGSESAGLRYWENNGTSTAPVFVRKSGSGSPFAVLEYRFSGYDFVPQLADIDGDGDVDL